MISLLISSVTCWLFRNVLFNLHVFVFLTDFFCNWYPVSALWLEKMLDMISIFLNLQRFDLWPMIWCILENVSCALEKKVYSSAFGWNVLKISMRSLSSNVSVKTYVSILIFCFDDLSIGVWSVRVSYYYSVIVNFSFNVC